MLDESVALVLTASPDTRTPPCPRSACGRAGYVAQACVECGASVVANTHRFRVIADYDAAYPEPITLQAGDRVRYERRESEWEGWLWCTSDSGASGWVPEAWLTVSDSFAVARRDYTARELTVRSGMLIAGSLTESGWIWAKTDAGVSGWVPLRVLERYSAS